MYDFIVYNITPRHFKTASIIRGGSITLANIGIWLGTNIFPMEVNGFIDNREVKF